MELTGVIVKTGVLVTLSSLFLVELSMNEDVAVLLLTALCIALT